MDHAEPFWNHSSQMMTNLRNLCIFFFDETVEPFLLMAAQTKNYLHFPNMLQHENMWCSQD